jgi:hypothetical protein
LSRGTKQKKRGMQLNKRKPERQANRSQIFAPQELPACGWNPPNISLQLVTHARGRSSSRARLYVPTLEPARPPPLVPELPAGLPELASPLAEHGLLQLHEIAVLLVHGIRESPGEFPPNDAGFVDVGADDGEWEVWCFL